MTTFLSLLKTQLNITFGFSALKYRFTKEKKKLWEPILIGLSIIIGAGSILSFFSFAMFGVFMAGKLIGRPELVLTISFVASQVAILFFGVAYIIGTFYFSKDMELLIQLPLKPSYILGSKFAIVMIEGYITGVPILLPTIIIFGLGTGQMFSYYLKSILVLITAPVMPLAIASIVVVILMRFINVRRNKDLFTVLGGLAVLILSVGWSALAQRMPLTNVQELVNSKIGLIEQAGQKFPASIWVTYGLSNYGLSGWSYILIYLAVSALLLIGLLWVGNQFYYKSLLTGQEVAQKRKTISKEMLDKRYERVASPVTAIFRREWKLFIRTPVFMLNGVAGMVIAPFLLLMPVFSKQSELNDIFDFIGNSVNALPVTLLAVGITLFTSNLNTLASTAVSREGHTFWVSKLIPVSAKEQILGKIIHGFIMELIGVLAAVLSIAVAFKLSISTLIIIFIISCIGNVLLIILNLIIDVLRPKLEWTNPQEAVKQNMNGLFGMIATIIMLGIMAVIAIALIMLNLPDWLVYSALGAIMSALSVPGIIGLYALAEYRYRNIEV